jgi:hypothetical protein
VKLFLRFAGQQDGTSWAMATGWLIEDDLLVTAGHCANDWSHNYGKLTHVKAYIGYTGKEAVSEANQVQMRMGIKVAAPESWLTKGNTDSRGDVSFICLNKPFTGVTSFKYIPTPMTGADERLGVVGYPGDLMKRGTGEKGAVGHQELCYGETMCLSCAGHVRNVRPNQLHTRRQQVKDAAVYHRYIWW